MRDQRLTEVLRELLKNSRSSDRKLAKHLNSSQPTISRIRKRLENGEEIPDCTACRGMLKPDIVMFEEQLPADVLQEASRRSMAADLFIVIGSTLVVYPAAYMPMYAVRAGAKLVIINLSSTPLDHQAAVVIRAKAGETMETVIKRLKGLS